MREVLAVMALSTSDERGRGSLRQLRLSTICVYLLFLAGVGLACYRRPAPDNLDRYIYEAIVRGQSQPLETVYQIVKREDRRGEESVVDSPEHLRELEPLYAIRPLYLRLIALASRILPIQNAITLISAASLVGIGVVVLLWTERPFLSALLMATYPVALLGKLGTPDGLAALLALAALWLLDRQKVLALGVLFISLGVRTENVILLFAVLVWLVWYKRLWWPLAAGLAVLGGACVVGIHHAAHGYGWAVLFRFCLIGGPYPAQMANVLGVREDLAAFVRGATAIAGRVAFWLLLGVLAWERDRDYRLVIVSCAVVAHFVLFPSPEDRYLVWAYITAGVALIRSLHGAFRAAGAVELAWRRPS